MIFRNLPRLKGRSSFRWRSRYLYRWSAKSPPSAFERVLRKTGNGGRDGAARANAWLVAGKRGRRRWKVLFSWCSPREAALHPILRARLIGANPLVVAIYALGASK